MRLLTPGSKNVFKDVVTSVDGQKVQVKVAKVALGSGLKVKVKVKGVHTP